MKKLIENLKVLAFIIIGAILILGGIACDYKIWRVQHPDAPMWSYIVSGK